MNCPVFHVKNGTFYYLCSVISGLIMNITKEIKELVRNFSDDYVLTASDFDFGPQSKAAVVKALNRMADSGELMKLSKGKFYKPRKTQFGILKPSVYQ